MTLTMFTLNAFYGLALAMNMFIIASGLNLIFGVLRVINFAHGMFYMFGAYIVFTVAKSWGAPFFVGVLAAGAALAAIAFVIERLLACGARIASFQPQEVKLEDAFLKLTTGALQ